MENTLTLSVSNDPEIASYKERLNNLRKPGVFLLNETKEAQNSIKKNKFISAEEKKALLEENQKKINLAKASIETNKEEIALLVIEATSYTKGVGKTHEKEVRTIASNEKFMIEQNHKEALQVIESDYIASLSKINDAYKESGNKEEHIVELKEARRAHKTALREEKASYHNKLQKCKDDINDAYLERRNTIKSLRNGHESFSEALEGWWRNRVYTFDLKKFFLNNALYISILFIYLICIIVAPLTGKGHLLSIPSILQILEQSSTRMFYALGVAGLILLAGTDLSVGRMIALGSVTTAVLLHNGPNVVTFFGLAPMDFTAMPMALRVITALGLSILLCTLFSTLAGFFTAKFKMHPFITTLSTQLLIYGLLYFSTKGTPTGGVESGIKDLIGGRWYIVGNIYFPKLVIYAIIAIVIVWFIWNKTKFGKNMYAVGGNKEAASVSGISVFWTTLFVFIMAGILYGFGSFFESFRSNSSAGTGQGWELDAIAACVVGGISFNGGIGKIRGAVLGVIIFTGLTYCLSFLNIDTNLQFVFKGIIIMAACALDSVKYLKKK